MSKIAAVIVTYNNNEMLGCLMEDVAAQTRLPDEIIVVDNGDKAGAEKIVKEKFTQAQYIKMSENTGSAGGYYTGIDVAMKNNDFVWTLDDDRGLPRDSLEELVKGFKRLEGLYKIAVARSVGSPDPVARDPFAMGAFTWCGSLIKTEIFLKEGMIDKDFFIYGEDMDYSYRLSKKGYIFFQIPTSICYDKRPHDKIQYRFFWKNAVAYADAFKLYYAVRNSVYIYMRHGHYLKTIVVLSYGLKVILLILFTEGLRGLVKIKAVIMGSIHGFMGKLGKLYSEK